VTPVWLLAAAVQLVPTLVVASFQIDPVTITLVGGMLVTIIGTIVTGVVTIINAIRIAAVGTQQVTDGNRLVAVAKDTEAIKGHVNSEKTAATGREAALQQENRLLREMLADKAITTSLLAQAAAARGPSRSTDVASPLPVEVINTPLVVEKQKGDTGE